MTAEETFFICEDSMEGIFTGIYEAYEKRQSLDNIHLTIGEVAQPSMFSTYEYVKPKEEKAEKVMRTLKKIFSEEDYRTICYALSSPDKRKADAVFHTIVWGLKGQYRHSILEHLSNDNVRITMELARNAGNEYLHLRGFTRFTELQGGVLYGGISPKNAILPELAEHFADRLPGENFVLRDEGRNLYALHPAYRPWFLMTPTGRAEVTEAGWSETEACYQELFRTFCHNISIEERRNLKLQRNLLPLHFRLYMTEFQDRN